MERVKWVHWLVCLSLYVGLYVDEDHWRSQVLVIREDGSGWTQVSIGGEGSG